MVLFLAPSYTLQPVLRSCSADAFSLRFCSLGGMQVLLCVWAGETQLLSFSTVLVHVCHLSHGLIRIVFVAHR